MSNIELLTEEQHENLRVMKYIGRIAKGTEVFRKDDGANGSHNSCYEWLKAPANGYARVFGLMDSGCYLNPTICTGGFRPVFLFSSIDEICNNGARVKKVEDGIWRIEGRYVPQDIIVEPEQKKELKQMLISGGLTIAKQREHPKFKNAMDEASKKGEFDLNKVEYLDEYVDIIEGNRYAIRQSEGIIEFELCKPMVAYAEQIDENKFIAVYEKAYFGGIPFNLECNYYSDKDFPNMLISQIMNGPLKKFIDLTMPERAIQIETKETANLEVALGDIINGNNADDFKRLCARSEVLDGEIEKLTIKINKAIVEKANVNSKIEKYRGSMPNEGEGIGENGGGDGR